MLPSASTASAHHNPGTHACLNEGNEPIKMVYEGDATKDFRNEIIKAARAFQAFQTQQKAQGKPGGEFYFKWRLISGDNLERDMGQISAATHEILGLIGPQKEAHLIFTTARKNIALLQRALQRDPQLSAKNEDREWQGIKQRISEEGQKPKKTIQVIDSKTLSVDPTSATRPIFDGLAKMAKQQQAKLSSPSLPWYRQLFGNGMTDAVDENNQPVELSLSPTLSQVPFTYFGFRQKATLYDFRKKKELQPKGHIHQIWTGFPEAPSQDGAAIDPEKLSHEKGRCFAVYLNGFDAMRKESDQNPFEEDLSRYAVWCDRGWPIFQDSQDKEKVRKATELIEKISKGDPTIWKRVRKYANQDSSDVALELIESRYGVTTEYEYRDTGIKPFPIHYNFYLDSTQTPYLEVSKIKRLLDDKNTFISYLVRINLKTEEMMVMWKVIESDDPMDDSSLDPMSFLTSKPL